MAKTSDNAKEYDELWGRIVENIDDIDTIYSREELKSRLDGKQGAPEDKNHYPLGTGNSAIETLTETEGKWGLEKIQDNLSKYLDEDRAEVVNDTQEADLVKEAKGAYSEKQKKKIEEKLENIVETNLIEDIESETKTKPDKSDIENVVKKHISKVPEHEKITKESKLTMELAKDTGRPSFVGRMRETDTYDDVLQIIKDTGGVSMINIAKELQTKGHFTEMKPDVLRRRIRDLDLVAKGYAKYLPGYKQIKLTRKGESMIERLKES